MKNTNNIKNSYADELFKAVLHLQTADECRAFFGDLCTENELAAISQRLYVAKLLHEKHVYSDIVNVTGASTATISRTNRSLRSGNGGYDIIFKRLGDNNGE
jgi:TrpR-related protein YerC/YecD